MSDLAVDIGLDLDEFEDCLSGSSKQSTLDATLDEAVQLGVGGTPTVVINGELLEAGGWPFEALEAIILEELP
jgi:predicted DsbA family dithiol-disulfide isomerase